MLLMKFNLQTYNFSYSIRQGKRGGGTAAICIDALRLRDVSLDDFSSFEYHAVILKCLFAVIVCRPPKHCPNVLSDLSELSSIISSNYDNMIIIADSNLHTDNNTDKKASDFSHLLEDLSFIQHVNEPTHSCGQTLDLVTTRGLSADISSVMDVLLSDHLLN